MKIPVFKTDKELFDFLVENEKDILYAKQMQIKYADSFLSSSIALNSFSNKATPTSNNPDEIKVKAVINTTYILDSHKDVHINGLWDKSLSENKRIKHLQEHQMKFDKIISDGNDLEAYVKEYTWKELGYDVEGKTQALVFESTIKRSRNSFMFDQYSKGIVDNHSVGMRYVKMHTCINNKDYEDQYENYKKYSKYVVNSEALKGTKYFWAVTEAKAIEGSAVVIGSNQITPTLSVKSDFIEDKEVSPSKSWLGI